MADNTNRIYGKEVVEFSWSVSDQYSALISDTLDWWIRDELLDGTAIESTVTDANENDKQEKIYESRGSKSVATECDFYDGWGHVFTHRASRSVDVYEYNEPVLDFTWTPEMPTVLEETTFTQLHEAERNDDVLVDKAFGRIESVNVDYYKDGTADEVGLAGNVDFTETLTPKSDPGIDIEMVVDYWDGWEHQEVRLTKHLTQTNIPPVAGVVREDAGQCIPAYIWDAEAGTTDVDDAIGELTYEWWLYKKDDNGTVDDTSDDTWVELETGSEKTFTYPFQYEGEYKLVMKATDDDGGFDEMVEEFPIEFAVCGADTDTGKGVVKLESDRFEMISMPVMGKTVHDYFIKKVEEVTGKPASESIQFCKAYPSNSVSSGKYLGFVPGVTNPLSSYNFKLVEMDGAKYAHVPFFVRTKVLSGPITIEWDSADGSA